MSLRKNIGLKITGFFKPADKFPRLREQNFTLSDRELPKEIIGEILNRLLLVGDTKDLIRMTLVNKQFCAFINRFINGFINDVLSDRIHDSEMKGAIVIRKTYPSAQRVSHFIASKLPNWVTDLHTGPGFKYENDTGVRQAKFERRCQLLMTATKAAIVLDAIILSLLILNLCYDEDARNNLGILSILKMWLGMGTVLLTPLFTYLGTGCLYVVAEVAPEQLKQQNRLFGEKLKEINFTPSMEEKTANPSATVSKSM